MDFLAFEIILNCFRNASGITVLTTLPLSTDVGKDVDCRGRSVERASATMFISKAGFLASRKETTSHRFSVGLMEERPPSRDAQRPM